VEFGPPFVRSGRRRFSWLIVYVSDVCVGRGVLACAE